MICKMHRFYTVNFDNFGLFDVLHTFQNELNILRAFFNLLKESIKILRRIWTYHDIYRRYQARACLWVVLIKRYERDRISIVSDDFAQLFVGNVEFF